MQVSKQVLNDVSAVYIHHFEGRSYTVSLWDQNVAAIFKKYDNAIDFALRLASYYQTYVVGVNHIILFPYVDEDAEYEDYTDE